VDRQASPAAEGPGRGHSITTCRPRPRRPAICGRWCLRWS